MTPQTKGVEEKRYINCDRCREEMQVSGDGPERVYRYEVYENGTLCLRCAKVRQFDDENPILHNL
jgi:hypothetical protein